MKGLQWTVSTSRDADMGRCPLRTDNGRKVYVWEAAMADHRRSRMMWRAAGYFITAVTIGGWVAVLAYWMHMHGWIHIRGLAITGAALIGIGNRRGGDPVARDN